MSRMVRVGIIGAGVNTRARHIPGFQAIPGVSVVAVCNRSRSSSEAVAREFGIPRVADSWQEIVAAPDIDAVCIGTWPDMHAALTVAALRVGKHVLTEARMARDLAEAEMMLAESKRYPGLVAQIVPAPMTLAFDVTVVECLRSGRLGVLREVVVNATTAGLTDATLPLSWRQDAARNGRNTLQLGIYYEVLLRWLGRDIVAVTADAGIFSRERRDADGTVRVTTVPESLTVLGRYADGARLIAHFSGVDTSGPRAEIRLNGAQGGLRLDLNRRELRMVAGNGRESSVAPGLAMADGWRVEADFIDSIRAGRPVRLTDFATGVRYMRFTEAVWESWNRGQVNVVLSGGSAPS